jgi:hypothetical protein
VKPTQSKNSKPKTKAIKHEQDALELRILGYSYRKIGKALGISDAGAYKAVNRAIAKQELEITESAKEVVRLALERIDELLPSAIDRAKGGNDKAISSVVRLLERQAKYLGLDEPDRLMLNGGLTIEVVDYKKAKKK